MFLAVRLLLRWRHGAFVTVPADEMGDGHRHGVRTPLGAFGIGLVHGMGGSAGVGVLLLAAIPDRAVAVAALLILAVFTAVSMTIVTSGFGATLTTPTVARPAASLAPALGVASLAFGVWYAAAAWSIAPYPF